MRTVSDYADNYRSLCEALKIFWKPIKAEGFIGKGQTRKVKRFGLPVYIVNALIHYNLIDLDTGNVDKKALKSLVESGDMMERCRIGEKADQLLRVYLGMPRKVVKRCPTCHTILRNHNKNTNDL